MESTKNKIFSKNKLIIIAFLAIIAILATTFVWQGTTVKAHASSDIISAEEDKRFSTATIDEDFLDDTVVVVLNQETSRKFLRYSPADFPELRLESVEDINENATRIVQEQIADERREIPMLATELSMRIFW